MYIFRVWKKSLEDFYGCRTISDKIEENHRQSSIITTQGVCIMLLPEGKRSEDED